MKPERWQHIDKLLGEALELDVSRRATFLDQVCAGDEDLRLRIDALLAAHEQTENYFECVDSFTERRRKNPHHPSYCRTFRPAFQSLTNISPSVMT